MLGRRATAVILMALKTLTLDGRIPRVPVNVDSPMGDDCGRHGRSHEPPVMRA